MPKSNTHYLATQRRGARRYEISLSLRYAVRRRGQQSINGTGESINVSSSGLLFRTDGRPMLGDSIIVALEWPAIGVAVEPIFLVLSGQIVRSQGRTTALSISRNELLRQPDLEGPSTSFCA